MTLQQYTSAESFSHAAGYVQPTYEFYRPGYYTAGVAHMLLS